VDYFPGTSFEKVLMALATNNLLLDCWDSLSCARAAIVSENTSELPYKFNWIYSHFPERLGRANYSGAEELVGCALEER
jgi:hypothetical protein